VVNSVPYTTAVTTRLQAVFRLPYWYNYMHMQVPFFVYIHNTCMKTDTACMCKHSSSVVTYTYFLELLCSKGA